MERAEYNGLILEVIQSESGITNLWKGKSRDSNPTTFLTNYFEKLINSVRDKKLIIDFSELEIMNSTTIRFLVTIMNKLDSEEITTTILFNKHSFWQPTCFFPLAKLANTLKYIKIQSKNDS